MTELKPCPFCGGKAELHALHDIRTDEVDGWFVWCSKGNNCDIQPMTGDYDTEAEAIAAWNTRAEWTCYYVGDEISGGCSECRGWLDPDCAYCPNCGAKVVD